MSWNNFLILILIIYVSYYALNLLFDLFISPKATAGDIAEDELFFSQTFAPELITPDEEPETSSTVSDKTDAAGLKAGLSSGTISSSGGVGLKQLFSLAKNNLIEHTRAIPY